jgi:hypothetical protein
MNIRGLVIWQRIFIVLNVLAFALLPFSITLNAGFVLVGKLFVWHIQSGIHLLVVILGIVLLVYARTHKAVLATMPTIKVRRSLISFLIAINLVVLLIGGFFTYIIMTMLN